jgi:hypothetical protein
MRQKDAMEDRPTSRTSSFQPGRPHKAKAVEVFFDGFCFSSISENQIESVSRLFPSQSSLSCSLWVGLSRVSLPDNLVRLSRLL